MNTLEKLKQLVASGASTEGILEQIEKAQNEEIPSKEESFKELPDYLESTTEETNAIMLAFEELKSAKLILSNLLLSYENRKSTLVQEVNLKQEKLVESLKSLRLGYGLSEEEYGIKMPSSPGDKIAFVKNK